MDLVIKEEKYKIQLGDKVYSVDYPSFEDAQKLEKEFKKIDGDGQKSLDLMKKKLVEWGLEPEFFKEKQVKAKHIMTLWQDLNSVKK